MSASPPPPRRGPGSPVDFLAGGGETGELLRTAVDWERTPLGAPAEWPKSLKTAVRIMLTSRQPIWVGWGRELTYLYNDPYKSIIGGKHPWALGRPTAEVWKEIWADIKPMLDTALKGDEGTYVEEQLLVMERHGYPEETYYTFSYSPVPDDDGSVGGIICANTDDTQRVIGERQLALLRELAARTTDARTWADVCARGAEALATDPKDLPFALVYVADPDAARFTLAASVGMPRSHFAAPEAIAAGEAGVWPLAAAQHAHGPVVVDLAADGDGFPTGAWPRPPKAAALLPIPASGDTGRGGVLVVGLNPFRLFDDGYRGFLSLAAGQFAASIASAEAFAAERARAEQLAELDRAKTAFFSNVSHEFRTPLTLMLGPLEDLLGPDGEVPPENREALATVHRNGQRLLKLVNSLLDFARIEAGRVQASYEPVDLAAYTAELASVFRSAVEKAGLNLVIDCPPLPDPVYVDRDMWEKVVLNLVSNAFKFTLQGEIRVRLTAEGGRAVLRVTDTGSGIPPHELPNLFNRFHRVEGAKGRTHEGTGIGLALVQELARLHGGEAAAESAYGTGSTFSVAVPLGRTHLPPERIAGPRSQASTALGSAPFVEEALRWLPAGGGEALPTGAVPGGGAAAGRRPRVVLADDNADMRDYVRRLLAGDYEVVVAGDGEEALRAAVAGNVDLVLTDVMMPGLDGFGLLKALRADPRTATVPVIMLSARAGEEARVEGLGAGADDYLVKPFSAKELVAKVAGTLALARARREAARREEELRAETVGILESMTEGFVALDTDWRFTYVNAAAERLVGLRREEFLGKIQWEVFPATLGTPNEAAFRKAMVERVPVQFENYYPPLGRWFEASAFPVDGRGIAVYFRDVTDRKQSEQTTSLLRAAIESANDSVLITEAAIDPPGPRIEYVNPAFIRMTGFTAEEAVGQTPRILQGPKTSRDLLARLRRDLAERQEFSGETTNYRKDGTEYEVEWRIAPVRGPGGEVRKWVAVQRDVTERKRAEEQLAEEARRKDEFLALLAHELRNPLAPLRNGLQVLRLARGESDAAERARGMMDRQLAHMVRLIDDLLDVSRISRGKLTLRQERLSLADVVAAAIETSRPMVEASGHELAVRLPQSPVYVDGDLTRLAQVFSNLLTNSAKYTPPGGRIRLAAETSGGRAVVSVTDTGIGIPAESLPRIFDMFSQVDRSIERSTGGLGIGLALVKGLVEMHGGTIEARSGGQGLGSTFLVTLPTVEVAAGHAGRPADSPAGSDGMTHRVLVVDDNRDSAESMAMMLSLLGGEVRVAHDGAEAVEAAEAFRPDVILMDVGMPRLNGLDATRRIRGEAWGKPMTILALTGWGQDNDRERSRAAGCDGHLVKPVALEDLERLLKALRPASAPAADR